MALELCILTLNVWGIPFVSKDRNIRIKAIANELTSGKYDIISLQEVWSENDYQLLKSETESVLPFAHYFYSGVVGSGLCVFSKHPIVSAFFHAWSVNGYVHRLQHGDWFGGKGVGFCKIAISGKIIHFYTAHLHAEYDRKCDDYMTHRVIQAFDTAQFVEHTRGHSAAQILAGDLNTEPGDLAYRVLLTSSKLRDAYNKLSSHGTNECAYNSYTAVESAVNAPDGKRIDYILFRPGTNYEGRVAEYKLPFPDKVPGHEFSYSDHEAVYSRLQLIESTKRKYSQYDPILNGGNNQVEKCDSELDNVDDKNLISSSMIKENIIALKESIAIFDESLKQLESHKKTYLWMAFAVLLFLIVLIDIQPPYGLKTLVLVLKILFSGLIMFFLFMGTLWNIMERHGILAGKLTMEITIRNIEIDETIGEVAF